MESVETLSNQVGGGPDCLWVARSSRRDTGEPVWSPDLDHEEPTSVCYLLNLGKALATSRSNLENLGECHLGETPSLCRH